MYMYLTLPSPCPQSGKRKRAAAGGASRSTSVKRETTPVGGAHKTTFTIVHNPTSTGKAVTSAAAPKRPPAAIKRSSRRSGSGGPNDGLGCNEEIAVDEEEEEEGECSATQCLQPVADQIIWVQCDHCQEWFHCICVGLTKEYAEQIDVYKCASCKLAATTTASAAATAVSSGGTEPRPRYPLMVGSLLSSFSSSHQQQQPGPT